MSDPRLYETLPPAIVARPAPLAERRRSSATTMVYQNSDVTARQVWSHTIYQFAGKIDPP